MFQEIQLDELLDEKSAVRTRSRRDVKLPAAIERQKRRQLGLARAVRGLRPYVRRHGNRLRLIVPTGSADAMAHRLGVKPTAIAILARAAARARPSLRPRIITSELDLETGGASCAGQSATSVSWWGTRVWLNACQTKALLSAMKVGAGAAAVCTTAVPAPQAKAACGAIAGLIAVGAGVVEAIDNLGGNNGIVISQPWAVPVPVVWHQ